MRLPYLRQRQLGTTKNGYFKALLAQAKARGFKPKAMFFDSWYASLANLKQVRDYGWRWLTQLKANRMINPDGKGNIAMVQAKLAPNGQVVHLKIRVFRTVAQTVTRTTGLPMI